MKSARVTANLMALAAIGAVGLLFEFPPDRYGFYPPCPVYRYLHLYCPGCGATRALAALLHGRLAEAMHYNPLFVMLLPLLLLFAGVVYWSAVTRNRIEWPQVPASWAASMLTVMAAFTLLRNL
jgi:hypothetical protein